MAALWRSTARLLRAALAWTRELTIMFGLYSVWQLAANWSVAQIGDAVSRGRDIAAAERWFHLPGEEGAQAMVLGDHTLVRWLDYYYAYVHVTALGLCLAWMFVRHRDSYPRVRNVLAVMTGATLLVQLVPVAPPRLVPTLGVVDTGRLIGPSVYQSVGSPGPDQLSAMPSLHVGWALVVAGSIVWVLRSRWRWLALLYPAFTTWAVVVTGNHYWADGLAELVIAFASLWAVVALPSRMQRARASAGRSRKLRPRLARAASLLEITPPGLVEIARADQQEREDPAGESHDCGHQKEVVHAGGEARSHGGLQRCPGARRGRAKGGSGLALSQAGDDLGSTGGQLR